jgi:hypothetical protein
MLESIGLPCMGRERIDIQYKASDCLVTCVLRSSLISMIGYRYVLIIKDFYDVEFAKQEAYQLKERKEVVKTMTNRSTTRTMASTIPSKYLNCQSS